MNRREFLVSTAGIVAALPLEAYVAACDDSSSSEPDGGTSGTSGSSAAGHGGSGGSGGANACTDPLPETQVADATGHTHTVTIAASKLTSTADQMFDTSVTGGHMHSITLTPAQFAMIKAGTAVTVVSTNNASHTHSYKITCTA